MTISVIILTFNEERNIGTAIDSVAGWAHEIFVVDSYSTDRTVDIALSRSASGVKVVQHAFKNYSDQWQWALRTLPLTGAWTMKLDADERLTPVLRDEISARLLAGPAENQGAYVRWKMMFLGKPINWGGVSRHHHLRLWRTGAATFEDREVNEHAMVQGKTVYLHARLEHHDYKSLTLWLSKHNRYSSMEAACRYQGNVTGGVTPRLFGTPEELRMWVRCLSLRLPMWPLIHFVLHYVFRLGFLDGRMGFRFWFLRSAFVYWIGLKLLETRLTGQLPEVDWPPRGTPHPQVAHSAFQRECDARSISDPPARAA